MKELARIRPEPISGLVRHLFAYGTLQPGLAPPEIAPIIASLSPVGEGFLFGKLYDLGSYPGAVIDLGSSWVIYGLIYKIPEDAEFLRLLDAYEGPEYTRIERLVTLVEGGVLSCWVYDYLGRPSDDRLIESGRWAERQKPLGA